MKRLASLLALLFFFQNVVLGYIAEPFSPMGNPRPMALPSWLSPAISTSARIQHVHRSFTPRARTIVIIQDAHLHTEAQTAIADVIDKLGHAAEEKGEKLQVGLEGTGKSSIRFSRYDAYPFRQNLRQAAEGFLKKNIINGAEFAVIGYLGEGGDGSINSSFVVSGIEDQTEYDENVDALRVSERARQLAERALDELSADLQVLKEKHFNAELRAFDQKFSAYETGTLSVPGYALYLDSVVPVTSPQLQNLISASLIEGSLNLPRTEQEHVAFVTVLMKNLEDKEAGKLLQAAKLLRSGLLSRGDYYRILQDMATDKRVSFGEYPELKLYMQYVGLCERIDHETLFDEVDSHEEAVRKKLSPSKKEREIVSLSKAYYLMRKLVERRLTESEWKKYSSLDKRRSEIFKDFERFYSLAHRRSLTMSTRMERAMNASGASTGVLVVGGFHSRTIFNELVGRNFNVVVLSPTITNAGPLKSSLDYLVSGKLPIDQLFTGERLFLNIPPSTAGPSAEVLSKAILSEADHRGGRSQPPEISFFGLTARDMVQILVNAIPRPIILKILYENYVPISEQKQVETSEDYRRELINFFAQQFDLPFFSQPLWDAASFLKGDVLFRREIENSMRSIVSKYFKKLDTQIWIRLWREREEQAAPPFVYVEADPQTPKTMVVKMSERALFEIAKAKDFVATRAKDIGVRLSLEQSRKLAYAMFIVHEIGEAILGISDSLLVDYGIADEDRVKEKSRGNGYFPPPFLTITGMMGELQNIVLDKINESQRQGRIEEKRHWKSLDQLFVKVPFPGLKEEENRSAEFYRERELAATEGLPETGQILRDLVPNPNERAGLNYTHVDEKMLFKADGLVSLSAFTKLMASPADQDRHRMVDDTVNRKNMQFVDAEIVYDEANIYGNGVMTVWDQKGGYHDVLVYADKLLKSKKRAKEIAVLQNGSEFIRGLTNYAAFLHSRKIQDEGVVQEASMAAAVLLAIDSAQLKIISLPEEIEIDKVNGNNEYNIDEAVKYFEVLADRRNCGKLVFVSDWRRLKASHNLRTTIQVINNMNLFVTTIDGVLRIATYAAKQA